MNYPSVIWYVQTVTEKSMQGAGLGTQARFAPLLRRVRISCSPPIFRRRIVDTLQGLIDRYEASTDEDERTAIVHEVNAMYETARDFIND